MALTHARQSAAVDTAAPLLDRLGTLCRGRGLERLAERLQALGEISGADLVVVEEALAALPRGGTIVVHGARHLLDLAGKRLRPLCVALAARAGSGFGPQARELAVAVELVHSATLLHDDVVDLGDVRRGAPTVRALWGNAASIFAGDWLLIEALGRVRRAEVPRTLDRLLAAIRDMILAESAQLENRGRLSTDRAAWLRIVEGKTAALFRWGLDAGGRAGGLAEEQCRALESYGLHLGVAFQAIDDLLDFTGNAAATGKVLFADLREGKMTYPLIVALEREPQLRGVLEEVLAMPPDRPTPEPLADAVLSALERTRSTDDCRAYARERAAEAMSCLAALPPSEARSALETVAVSAVERSR